MALLVLSLLSWRSCLHPSKGKVPLLSVHKIHWRNTKLQATIWEQLLPEVRHAGSGLRALLSAPFWCSCLCYCFLFLPLGAHGTGRSCTVFSPLCCPEECRQGNPPPENPVPKSTVGRRTRSQSSCTWHPSLAVAMPSRLHSPQIAGCWGRHQRNTQKMPVISHIATQRVWTQTFTSGVGKQLWSIQWVQPVGGGREQNRLPGNWGDVRREGNPSSWSVACFFCLLGVQKLPTNK